jgi:hypothetical protein
MHYSVFGVAHSLDSADHPSVKIKKIAVVMAMEMHQNLSLHYLKMK